MTKIEKAVETLKQVSDLDTKLHLNISNYDLLTAIEALQEKAEREKWCEYCKGDNYRYRKNIPLLKYHHTEAEVIIDSDNTLYISNTDEDIAISTQEISFCPMCGRSLKEESH